MTHDLLGRQFGRLRVVRRNGSSPDKRALWFCVCECGGTTTVTSRSLLCGTKSCGCLKKEHARVANMSLRNGRSASGLSLIYGGMLSRCYNPHHDAWNNYGGRGIEVAERWLGRGGFASFAADMGKRPSIHHTLDRIDVNGPYAPGNCRWATKREQCRNTRYNRRITYDGVTMNLCEWSEVTGLKRTTISARLSHGWTVEDALTIQKGGRS
jgi:hypothetical protein